MREKARQRCRAKVALREIKRKSAALIRRANQANFPTQERRQFAADRQPQSGPAESPAGSGIGLMEGFEDYSLLIRLNSDSSVTHLKSDDPRRIVEHSVIAAPTTFSHAHREGNPALHGKLKRVGK